MRNSGRDDLTIQAFQDGTAVETISKLYLDACDNTTATVLAHVVEHYSNTCEEPARKIQPAQELSLNEGLNNFG